MADHEPEEEEENPTQLRNDALEALQNAARQRDPEESDRLTRYALALIDRARAIRQRRRRAVSESEEVVTSERQVPRKRPDAANGSTTGHIRKLWQLWSSRRRH
jgi:thioesterase domain-containing protein